VKVLVIPVPDGYTTEDALMETQTFGHLVDREVSELGDGGTWAVVEVYE
jgi:hypothetical protein